MGNKKVAVVLLEVKKVVQTPTKGVLGFPRCMEGGAKIILLPGQFYVGLFSAPPRRRRVPGVSLLVPSLSTPGTTADHFAFESGDDPGTSDHPHVGTGDVLWCTRPWGRGAITQAWV
jgi:hypothetical protein